MKLTKINQTIKKLKQPEREYPSFIEEDTRTNPFHQFIDWFSEALESEKQPTITILSTVDENGFPDARAVSLQELEEDRFIFYSVYNGRKGRHIDHCNIVSLTFYWPNLARQIRIKGKAEKVEREKSKRYFSNRNREIQLTIYAWIQSTLLEDRKDLENRMKQIDSQFYNQQITCPDFWGGYAIIPFEYEFYQRRFSLMNDIFYYKLQNNLWKRFRLAP